MQGSETWEIQSSDEEAEVILVEEPEKKARSVESAGKAKVPAISKAVAASSSSIGAIPKSSSSVVGAIPKATAASVGHSCRAEEETSFPRFSEGGSSSSRVGARLKIAAKARPKGSGAISSSEPAAAKELPVSRLKPRTTVLPDTVLWFDRPLWHWFQRARVGLHLRTLHQIAK